MARTVDFYSDYLSPYAYLAWLCLPEVTEPRDVEIVPRPVLFAGLPNHWGRINNMGSRVVWHSAACAQGLSRRAQQAARWIMACISLLPGSVNISDYSGRLLFLGSQSFSAPASRPKLLSTNTLLPGRLLPSIGTDQRCTTCATPSITCRFERMILNALRTGPSSSI